MSSEQALKAKQLGNEAYKRKEFATAHKYYDEAIKHEPTNIVFYSNKAAVFFEEGKYDECIEMCGKAVEIGRENRADYALVAKAYARMANSYKMKDDPKKALHFYEKALSEHRDPDIVKKHKELAKEVKEMEQKAYIDPELSDKEKNMGNQLFKKGDYPGAMRHYNEAIKRNPDNAVLYSNRAACFTKLMEFQRAVDDCDLCLKKDPSFVKAYIRKGAALSAMREFGRAQKAYEDALQMDSSNHEAMEGLRTCMQSNEENPERARERALQDPEVQEILRDPGMRVLLEQMSHDPDAAREHIRNPDIFRKLMKLQEAGVIQIR
ncbi:hypothetical protein niasHT_028079 [Heterodera trifolii]|uniref:Stress-induced-phosphoprotein 1 n=1 Tax=Heterodera trifolii TaxID=157864 RepID=A0ABD2KEP6_9BILA